MDCDNCHAPLPAGAGACPGCGATRQRVHLGAAEKVAVALLALEILVGAVVGSSWTGEMREMMADFLSTPPAVTRLVIAPWFMPGGLALVVALSAVGLFLARRPAVRASLLALALFLGGALPLAAWWGVWHAVHEIAADIKVE